MARCQDHTCNLGALTFHTSSARRKYGEHGAHGEGLALLAEPSINRVIGLAVEVHGHPGGLLKSVYENYAGLLPNFNLPRLVDRRYRYAV